MSCGVVCRRSSDLALLWLWRRLLATALIRPLTWEPPYAMGVALEKAKRPKKKKSEKVNALDLIRKEKIVCWGHHRMRMNLLWKCAQRKICAGFAIVPQTAKVIALVHGKCLVKVEKALNLFNKILGEREWNWGREEIYSHNFFFTRYCHNRSTLLLVIAMNLFLCLIYKLNFTPCMHA